ncbi:MAG: hypothetical protein E6Q76_00950 [Rhizobium sp.]|nr:MAG: hypothetical protein E6Q76_00950 [Rhizobium sp.]
MREVLGLLQPFWPLALSATIFGIISGLSTARLLAIITTGRLQGDVIWPLLAHFILRTIVIILAGRSGRNVLLPYRVPAGLSTSLSGAPYLLRPMLRRSE